MFVYVNHQQLKWVFAAVCIHLPHCSLLVQSHRHEIHKSQNKVAAQWELREKALKRRLRHEGSPAPLDQTSLSIIREVSDDEQFLCWPEAVWIKGNTILWLKKKKKELLTANSFSEWLWCVVMLQVFSDQLLLQDVLARSDRAMAVVKDLFGDAPRRQTGNTQLIL